MPTRSSSESASSSASRLLILRTLIGPRVTFCRIVLCAKRLNDWNTMPDVRAQLGQRLALGGQRHAVDRDGARVDGLQPVDRPAQRRLPGTGRADHDHHLAGRHVQLDVLEHVQRRRSASRRRASRSSAAPRRRRFRSMVLSRALSGDRSSSMAFSRERRVDYWQCEECHNHSRMPHPCGASSPNLYSRRPRLIRARAPRSDATVGPVARRTLFPVSSAAVTLLDRRAAGAPRTYQVRTYGCQMNVHDSERLSGLLEDGRATRAAPLRTHVRPTWSCSTPARSGRTRTTSCTATSATWRR